jgi:SAM-dependent methyltransferase
VSYTLETYDPDEDFDRWYTDTTGRRIRERLDDLNARTVLEIGCATGRMTEQLAFSMRYSQRLILACTLDERMAARAREREIEGVEVVWGNVLDMKAMEFQAIVCCSVLHEVPSVDAILRKCHELLAPGGTVFVVVPSADSLHLDGYPPLISERGNEYGVRRLLGVEQWHTLMITGTGLRVVDREQMMLKPYPNARMAVLEPTVLAHLAAYRGMRGALVRFELQAAL